MPEIIILGAGLTGLSCSYHIGHQNCVVFEKNNHAGGHIYSTKSNGYTWDEGPHVSFTEHEYVKKLFEESVEGKFLEYPVFPMNYYKGHWIPHPAQSNLYAVPEPLRSAVLSDFVARRQNLEAENLPDNYEEWLHLAFGKKFSDEFSAVYTQKYWTVSPAQLGTDWVGSRIFYPDIETVKRGFYGPQGKSTHYISSVRYPLTGGYMNFASKLLKDANISNNKNVNRIDLIRKTIEFDDGSKYGYNKLISTLPITDFIKYCETPEEILEAANKLVCSQLLIINIEVNHQATRLEQWLYVYDEDKYATRINFTELLSPENAPAGKCGIQVEVYFSNYKPVEHLYSYYAAKVVDELVEMGLIKGIAAVENVHTKWVEYANVIFDHQYKSALNIILSWLQQHGLTRESDDLFPMTDWDKKLKESFAFGDVIFAGRFGQWKYYWTDDCILRGKYISDNL